MKRAHAQWLILLILLLSVAVMISSVSFAKYQAKSEKTLSLSIQKRYIPKVERITEEIELFRITNEAQTDKTIALRVRQASDQQEVEVDKLAMHCEVNGVSSPVGSLLQLTEGSATYCAFDGANREMIWTLGPGQHMDVFIDTIDLSTVELSAAICSR